MATPESQPDFDPISIKKLRETLRQTLPALEKLISLARDFCAQKTETSSPCESCTKKDNCSEQCQRLQMLLPKINSGRGSHENRCEFHDSTLTKIQQQKHLDVFGEYEACKQFFTDKQWVVICLRYRDGKKIQEIAEQLGKAISTVNEHLKKAEKRKEEHDRRLRAEKLEYLKKINNSDP